jgi:hypothetical protein
MSLLGVTPPWAQQDKAMHRYWRQQARVAVADLKSTAPCLALDVLEHEQQACTQGNTLQIWDPTPAQCYYESVKHLWKSWQNMKQIMQRWGYTLSHPLTESTWLACDHWVWFQALCWGRPVQEIRQGLDSIWLHPNVGLLVVHFVQARFLNTTAFYAAMESVMTTNAKNAILVLQSINVTSNMHFLVKEVAHFQAHAQPVTIQFLLQAHLRICHRLTTLPLRILTPAEEGKMLAALQPQASGQAVVVQDLPQLLTSDIQCFLYNVQPGQVVAIRVPRDGGWYTEYRRCQWVEKSFLKLMNKFEKDEMRKCWPTP